MSEKTPNEKYLDTYIDVLKNTINDQVHRNLSQQANSKMLGDVLQDLKTQNDLLLAEIEKLNDEKSIILNNSVEQKNSEIENLKKEFDNFTNVKNSEITTLKSQIQNTSNSKETEVINLRNQIQDVQNQKNNEINNLKNVIENLNKEKTELNVVINSIRNEYNSIKLQVDHIETFKNQIIQMQQTLLEKNSIIDDLNIKLNELKSSTKKKKKIFENTSILEEINSSLDLTTEETNRDGGSF